MDIISRTGWGAIAPRGLIYRTARSTHHGVGASVNGSTEAQANQGAFSVSWVSGD